MLGARPPRRRKARSVAPDQDRLPRLTDGFDLRALPIGPSEAFVLSRVDGTSTEAEIAAATALTVEEVARTLSRLAELGAVRFEAKPSSAPRIVRKAAERAAPVSLDAGAADEVVDLDLPRKQKILETFDALDRLSHYELLGADPSADKRAIKAKYFEVVNVFHPDRYYGKRLGSFKPKLERIFQRLTEAHDVLTRAQARAEYDAYLNAEQRTKALDQKLNDEEAYARELREVTARIEAEALSASPAPPSSAPVIRHSSPPPNVSPAAAKADADARRRALARKLGLATPRGSSSATAVAAPTPAPAAYSGPSSRERAVDELKRRYEQRMTEAKRRQVAEYEDRAQAALAKGSQIDAVNALRIACSLAPDDTRLRSRLADLEQGAGRELADRYLAQAAYEEREKRWADAARSYTRAHAGAPSSKLHERIADCLLNAQGDIRRALEHARNAVLESPNEPKYRVTLARAYLVAKMRDSAIGELERAAALAPTDDSIREQIRRVRRGEI